MKSLALRAFGVKFVGMRVLIIGCGYVGLELGSELLRRGHSVFGMGRGSSPVGAPPGLGWISGDVTRPETLLKLPSGYDWVVFCVSSSHGTPADYEAVYHEGIRNVLAWLRNSPPARFVYTSSTGVYPQNDGSLVDESSPVSGTSDTNRILIQAEQALLDACRKDGFPGMVLRLTGIYGPGRGYWLRQFLKGEIRFDEADNRWLNMIHREDAASGIIAALERGRPGEIYNVCDDEPVQLLHLLQWLSSTLHQPMPQARTAGPVTASKRGVTSKRVSNRKLRDECGWVPGYPTFRQGFGREIACLPGT